MTPDGTESLGITEAVKAECSSNLEQLKASFNLVEFAEAAGQPTLEGGLSKWDEVVGAEIAKLPDGSQQIRAEIFRTLTEAAWYLEQGQYETAASALYDASDNAYDQAGIEGFEDLDEVSAKIDEIAKKIKSLVPES